MGGMGGRAGRHRPGQRARHSVGGEMVAVGREALAVERRTYKAVGIEGVGGTANVGW